MLKINILQGKRYTFATHINEMLLPREQAESIEAFRVVVEPGKQTHLHVHTDTEQLYYVISGAGAGRFEHPDGRGERFTMAPGDVIHVPRNTRHQISCAGDEPLTYLCVDAFPGGKPVDEPTWDHHYEAVRRMQMAQQGVLEVIEEAAITPEQDQVLRQLCVESFDAASAAFFAHSRHWHGSAPTYSVVGRVAGVPCAHVGVVVRRIRCGATPLVVGGIQNVCVRPASRGQGLGPWVMRAAMDQMAQRGIPFGLLFCVPELESYYAGMGWTTIHVPVTMNLDGGPDEALPAKNIAMIWPAGTLAWPAGSIHLQGADW